MATRMFNGKPIIVAGGNRAGAVPISPGSPQVYSGAPVNTISPMTPTSAPALTPPPSVRPTPTTEFAATPVSTFGAGGTPPVLKAAPAAGTFGAGNNLINKQISAPSSGSNSLDKQAAQYAQSAGMGDYSKQTQQARNMIMKQLRNLQNAPDRFELAQSNYDQFQKDADPAYQQQLRGVGQKAAAFGRIGAGMTTNDLTGALGQHQNLLSSERTRGLNQALENTMGDRLGVSQALQSGGGLLGGQDLSMGQAQSQAALGQAGMFGNLGQNQYGRQANESAMQQQQQQYQSGLDQQNIQNQIAQQQLQMQGQNQGFQQQFAQQQLAAQIAAQQNTAYPNAYGGNSITSGQLGYQSGY